MPLETQTLVLLSCSHAKKSGGRVFDPTFRRITQALGDHQKPLIARRVALLKLLRGETGRLHNEDQKGGYRDLRPCNRTLIAGPEFGGPAPSSAIYLPAYERYCGRFFVRLTEVSSSFWADVPSQSVEILFVSALYGLLFWNELIQDYDAHFADRTRNGKEHSVSEIWRHTLTSSLCDLFEKPDSSGAVGTVYDLLSEEEYQHAFRWGDLEKRGVRILHRVMKDSHGPDVLPDLATLIGTQLSRFVPGKEQSFESGQWYDLGDGTSQVRFEPAVFSELDHLKEALTAKPAETLRLDIRNAARFPPDTLQDLCLAEALWRKFRASRGLPGASVVVSFATAVEGFLRLSSPSLGTKTLGEFAFMSRDRKEFAPAGKNLKELNQLRRRAAHRELDSKRLDKGDAETARRLAYEIIERLVK